MKKNKLVVLLGAVSIILSGFIFSCGGEKKVPQTITFKSKDGLKITADLYMPHPKEAPFIVLCHRSGWSRGEYKEIAPWVNTLGINCIAIDQRSGGKINMVSNETLIEAAKKGLDTNFLDAEQDIIATIELVKRKYAKGKVIVWGSSYSASLALIIAAQNPELTDGVIIFSPGEYFTDVGKPNDYVITHAAKVTVPVFMSSMSSEAFGTKKLFNAVTVADKRIFIPSNGGRHGSESLWSTNALSQEYRDEVKAFLTEMFF